MWRPSDREIEFLHWLCQNEGRRAVIGDIDCGPYRRMVEAGYVEVKPNRFSANTLYFTITNGGRQTLKAAEHGRAS
jgi:hypothetical protein